MSYTPTTWQDYETGATPITAAELNRIDGRVGELSATLGAADDIDLATEAPVLGDKLYFDGTKWVPVPQATGEVDWDGAAISYGAEVLDPPTDFAADSVGFDMPANGELRYTGEHPLRFLLGGGVNGETTANNQNGRLWLQADGVRFGPGMIYGTSGNQSAGSAVVAMATLPKLLQPNDTLRIEHEATSGGDLDVVRLTLWAALL